MSRHVVFVRVSATDGAGNASVVTRKIVVKKPKKKGGKGKTKTKRKPAARKPSPTSGGAPTAP